jgi:fucose permease
MNTQPAAIQQRNSYVFPLIIIGALFFIFGFVTWANSQLIPYLKIACELSDTQSFLVATAFFAAYFVMAIPSSIILRKTGFKKGMSLGTIGNGSRSIVIYSCSQFPQLWFVFNGLVYYRHGLGSFANSF